MNALPSLVLAFATGTIGAIALPACGGAAPPAAEPAHAGTEIRCYAGTTQVHLLPANQHVADGTIVARRTTDPARSIITEEVHNAVGTEPPRSFRVTMHVKGSRFTMTEANGAFTGEGELRGPAWQWTEWIATSKLPDGTVVTSRDTATADGFAAEKTVTSADGVARVKIVESIGALDCAEFDARVSAMTKP